MIEWHSLVGAIGWFCCCFLVFSALVMAAARWAETRWEATAAWRRFWMFAVLMCWLPGVLGLLPVPVLVEPVVQLPPLMTEGAGRWEVALGEPVARQPGKAILPLLFTLLVGLVTLIGGYRFVRVLAGVWHLYRHFNVSASGPVPARAQTLCRRLSRATGVRIVFTRHKVSPFVFGLVRPRLVLSYASLEALDFSALQLVLRHEWVHIKRRDHQWVLVLHLLSALAWFNPFYLRLNRQLLAAIELDCDATVLRKRPGKSALYARTLLALITQTSAVSAPVMPAFHSPTHKDIKMRLGRIVRKSPGVSRHQQWWIGAGAACLLCASVVLQPLIAVADEMREVVFQHPVPSARVSSSFGQKTERFHNGIDLAIAKGTPIVAAADGRVLVSTDVYGNRVNYGKLIIIEHANGLRSLYSHLDSRVVAAGDNVSAGQLIGAVGETGKVTGPHLHFEILSGDDRLDPARFIDFPVKPAARAALADERMPRVY